MWFFQQLPIILHLNENQLDLQEQDNSLTRRFANTTFRDSSQTELKTFPDTFRDSSPTPSLLHILYTDPPVNCILFCLGTVSKSCVGELSCR